jgi:hypothetical protein
VQKFVGILTTKTIVFINFIFEEYMDGYLPHNPACPIELWLNEILQVIATINQVVGKT